MHFKKFTKIADLHIASITGIVIVKGYKPRRENNDRPWIQKHHTDFFIFFFLNSVDWLFTFSADLLKIR